MDWLEGCLQRRDQIPQCDESVRPQLFCSQKTGFNKESTADIQFFILDFPAIIQ